MKIVFWAKENSPEILLSKLLDYYFTCKEDSYLLVFNLNCALILELLAYLKSMKIIH